MITENTFITLELLQRYGFLMCSWNIGLMLVKAIRHVVCRLKEEKIALCYMWERSDIMYVSIWSVTLQRDLRVILSYLK